MHSPLKTMILALLVCMVMLAPRSAPASPFGVPTTYLNDVETYLKDGNIKSARFKLDMAVNALENEDKKDPRYATLSNRAKELEAKVAAAEKSAATGGEAAGKADEARLQRMWAENHKVDDPEAALGEARDCIKLADEAMKIDPSNADAPEYSKSCHALADELQKIISGDVGDKASETPEGQFVTTSINALHKVITQKKIDAKTMWEALQGAEECGDKVTTLTSRIQMYRGKARILHTEVGDLTLEQAEEKCRLWKAELKDKKATGCGEKAVMVEQTLIGLNKWGPVTSSVQTRYEYIPCEKMPKASKFAGKSKSYAAKFKNACGGKAIFDIRDADWVRGGSDDSRMLSGSCYEKGDLYFGVGSAMMAP
jgi:hypothetical protein